jgi:hypothetical protein
MRTSSATPRNESSPCVSRPERIQAGSASAFLPVSTSVVRGDWRTDRRERSTRRHSNARTGASPSVSVHIPLPRVELASAGSTLEPSPAQRTLCGHCESQLGVCDGSKVELSITDTVAAHRTDVTSRRKEFSLSRPALISLSLVECVDAYEELLAEVVSDGRIEPDEARSLVRRFRPIRQKCGRLHSGLVFVDRAIHGDGIDSPWFERKRTEDLRDRLYLVRSEDPDPTPAGPAAAQKKAA